MDHSHTHSDHVDVPRGALIAAAVVVVLAIALAVFGRQSGIGRTSLSTATPLESRTLFFDDREDGAVIVRDAKANNVVVELQPGSSGFVRVAMRGLARDRKMREIGPQTPFVLTRWSDQRVTVDDPETGRRIDLQAFGKPNGDAFARLLDIGKKTP